MRFYLSHRDNRFLTKCRIDKFDNVFAKRATWKKWPKTAYRYKLCLFDWPDDFEIPGPDFDYKSLSIPKLDRLIRGYRQNQLEKTDDYIQPNMERWGNGNC